MKLCPVIAELFYAEGLTDTTKLMVTYWNFMNPPKNVLLIEDKGTVAKIYKDFQA